MQPIQKLYPIAETFSSIQGEGTHCGRLMLFVRLAGCTVGKPYLPEEITKLQNQLRILPTAGHDKCTAWDGNSFICDTNYKLVEKLTPVQILSRLNKETTICLTGGEPLMHDLKPLLATFIKRGLSVHIETSGTIDIIPIITYFKSQRHANYWITVSPKKGFLLTNLAAADEIKVLVDSGIFDEEKFKSLFEQHFAKTFIQPINFENSINPDNMDYCFDLLQKFSKVRLSAQLHKYLNVR